MRFRAIGFAGLLSLGLLAHEGPKHEIDDLSRRMAQEGETADLLLERAIEYRTLGRWSEAAKDLQRAARLAPADPLLLRELAQVQLRRGRHAEALETLRPALRLPDLTPQERAAILMIRSQVHEAGRSLDRALEDCNEALRADPTLVGGYLDRSGLQRRLKRRRERVTGLDEGIRRTGAGVLVAERVEALLDDAQWSRALEAIGGELEASRLKGAWRIRRARALLGLGRTKEAQEDLRESIAEIDRRMPAGGPEASLLLDRALAHELSGETERALRDYSAAADLGAGEPAESALQRLRAARPTGPALRRGVPRRPGG